MIDAIYIGLRENMIAEVAAFNFTEIGIPAKACKYAILPVGEAQYDTDYASNLKDAEAIAKEYAAHYGCEIRYI